MSWQDIVLASGGFIFAVALIPSVLSKDKPALVTSLSTGCVLALFTVTYITLSLWLAAIATSVSAIMWFILAIQTIIQRGKSKKTPLYH